MKFNHGGEEVEIDDALSFLSIYDKENMVPDDVNSCSKFIRDFIKWVTVVRKEYDNNTWVPIEVDVLKSRLLWWISKGNEPLEFKPPRAYSCPWYEVVVEQGLHSCFEAQIKEDGVIVAQCKYDLVEKVNDIKYIVGYGPYRFNLVRDVKLNAERIAMLNSHRDRDAVINEMIIDAEKNHWRGWFLERNTSFEQS